MTQPRRTRTMTAALTVAIAALIAVASGAAIAEERSGGGVGAAVAGSARGACAMGYDTQTSTLVPPDDSTSDNVAAGTILSKKGCVGPVVGTLSAVVSTSTAGDFIHLDMRATCTSKGGFTGATSCVVGEQVIASPGHAFFRNDQGSVAVHSATMVWPELRKGVWRYEALPGGNNRANLQFRSFAITAWVKAA